MPAPSRLPTWLLVLLCIGAGLVLAPFTPWVCLALWLGLYARRIHTPLTRKLGGRSSLAATLTISLLLVLAIPIAAIVGLLIADAVALVKQLLDSPEAYTMFSKVVSTPEQDVHTAREAITSGADAIVEFLMSQGDRAMTLARSVFGAAAKFVVGLLIMVTGMFGVLVEGKEWYRWIERHTPLTSTHFARFRDAFLETGRGLWWGIVGAGFVQSVIATITYVALGVGSAFALGMLTLLFSVVPAIGTAIVWLPVAVGLFVTGSTAKAIIMFVVGGIVIGSIDNLARPWLARRGQLQLPGWVVLIAMFGGIAIIGGWGIVLGPLVVRMAKEALAISREAHDPATHSPASPGDLTAPPSGSAASERSLAGEAGAPVETSDAP